MAKVRHQVIQKWIGQMVLKQTTGPLGQGIYNAVGLAMAEAHLAATYNRPGYEIVDHYTYALNGDGDLMEGVSQEAASLAAQLKLGKLVLLYDSNDISLMAQLQKSFPDDIGNAFRVIWPATYFGQRWQ